MSGEIRIAAIFEHLDILVSHDAKNCTIKEALYVAIALELFFQKGHMEDGIQLLLSRWNGVLTASNLLQEAKEEQFEIVLPLPPGAFSGLWENQETFHKLYFQKFPGYYDTMDAGYMDEDGYLYVLSRADDVINVAGHRISAGAIEECVLFHHAVADCAVVGLEDPLKGHVPFALCVLREGIKAEEEKILEEIVKQVRANIGPVAAFQKGAFVKQLPKTRSGKIPRAALSALVSGKPYKITPTIEDASVFKHIEEVLKKS